MRRLSCAASWRDCSEGSRRTLEEEGAVDCGGADEEVEEPRRAMRLLLAWEGRPSVVRCFLEVEVEVVESPSARFLGTDFVVPGTCGY